MLSFDLVISGNSEQIRPRNWQTQLIQLFRRRLLREGDSNRDLLVHAGPGAGKTLGALLSFQAMKKEGLLSRYMVFCHRNSIISQWIESSERIGLKIKSLDISQEQGIPNGIDGLILSYQSASRTNENFIRNLKDWSSKETLAIADEAHHLGIDPEEPEGPVWGRTFLDITKQNRIRLGLTGTPFRADNLAFCSARKITLPKKDELIEQISPDLCVEPKDLIEEGDVRPLEFHFLDGFVEHSRPDNTDKEFSSISRENRESWRARNLRRAISFSDESSIALNLLIKAKKKLEKTRNSHKNAAGLVIARDIEHANAIAKILKENGDNVEVVHSNERNASERLANFEKADSLWLVSVDMCSEGFDAPRLRVVAYLTTVITKSRFIQAITRAVRMSCSREQLENVPRDPSYVFAPADPVLMEYARSWSISKPYLIRRNNYLDQTTELFSASSKVCLPLEAINHQAGEIIRMRTLELPDFLKR